MRYRTIVTLLAAVLVGVVGVVALPVLGGAARRQGKAGLEPRSVTLTALMHQGVWTDEPVMAANAWRRDFRRAQPTLEVGKEVRLRLESADVVHSFSVPGLGIDPVEVYPGKSVDLAITPTRAGRYEYYCTTVCGPPHFAMRGFIDVTEDDGTIAPDLPHRPGGDYWRTPLPGPLTDRAERGAALFRRSGCVTCHGEAGEGGVLNPSSMNPLVPELASLARKTFLFSPSDVAAFRRLLAEETPLGQMASSPDIPLFDAVRSQYLATHRLVKEGRRSTKLDPSGPVPTLDMPAWGGHLTDEEIDLILESLLQLGEAGPTALPNHQGRTQ